MCLRQILLIQFAVLVGLAFFISPTRVMAQEFPVKTMRFMVGYSVGSSSDIVSRLHSKVKNRTSNCHQVKGGDSDENRASTGTRRELHLNFSLLEHPNLSLSWTKFCING